MFVSKRIMILVSVVVALVMLGLGVGLAYALSGWSQASTNNTNISATATAVAVIKPTQGPRNGSRRVNGVIQSLGTSSFTISVDKGKRTVTVNVSTSTKYTHNGQSASFSDLQVGETVTIMGAVDTATSTVQATRVVISPPTKATGTPTPTPTATP